MVYTLTHGIDMDSWYRHGLMVWKWIHGIDLWYRHGLMVLTTPMVFTETDGIVSVLLDHTHMRRPSVARMRDFKKINKVHFEEKNYPPWPFYTEQESTLCITSTVKCVK